MDSKFKVGQKCLDAFYRVPVIIQEVKRVRGGVFIYRIKSVNPVYDVIISADDWVFDTDLVEVH